METMERTMIETAVGDRCSSAAAVSYARSIRKELANLDRAIQIGLREIRLNRGDVAETKASVLQLVAQRRSLHRTAQQGQFSRHILTDGPREARDILRSLPEDPGLPPVDQRTLCEIRRQNETPAARRCRQDLEEIEAWLASHGT